MYKRLERQLRQVTEERMRATNSDFFFIQIGANDGKTLDPIYSLVKKYRWRGILVEPIEYLFNRLTSNYRNMPGLFFENVAIADHDGYCSLNHYNMDSLYYRIFGGQKGTLKNPTDLKHRWRLWMNSGIVRSRVRCMTFANLIRNHSLERIDLLVIDTEGYDFEIIKQIDLMNMRPEIIFYEHKHLNSDDIIKCRSLLSSHGYNLQNDKVNTLAIAQTLK